MAYSGTKNEHQNGDFIQDYWNWLQFNTKPPKVPLYHTFGVQSALNQLSENDCLRLS